MPEFRVVVKFHHSDRDFVVGCEFHEAAEFVAEALAERYGFASYQRERRGKTITECYVRPPKQIEIEKWTEGGEDEELDDQ